MNILNWIFSLYTPEGEEVLYITFLGSTIRIEATIRKIGEKDD